MNFCAASFETELDWGRVLLSSQFYALLKFEQQLKCNFWKAELQCTAVLALFSENKEVTSLEH